MTGVYIEGINALLTGLIDLSQDQIRAVLLDAGNYTPDFQVHGFYDEIPGNAIVAGPLTLANTTVSDGTFNADDVTFTSVPDTTAEYILIYRDTGDPSNSNLLALYEASPVVDVDGEDVTVLWPAQGILRAG